MGRFRKTEPALFAHSQPRATGLSAACVLCLLYFLSRCRINCQIIEVRALATRLYALISLKYLFAEPEQQSGVCAVIIHHRRRHKKQFHFSHFAGVAGPTGMLFAVLRRLPSAPTSCRHFLAGSPYVSGTARSHRSAGLRLAALRRSRRAARLPTKNP